MKEIKTKQDCDEFAELKRAATALTRFVEHISDDLCVKEKQLPDAAYAALPEAARVLKEIIETIHL